MIIIIIINFIFHNCVVMYTAYRLQLAAWLNCNWGGGVDCFLCISNTFIWKGIVKLLKLSPGEGFKNVSHSILYWFLCIFNTFMWKSTKRAFRVWTNQSSFSGGGSKLSIFLFCIDFCACAFLIKISTLSCETPPKVHFVSKLTGMSNFERNPLSGEVCNLSVIWLGLRTSGLSNNYHVIWWLVQTLGNQYKWNQKGGSLPTSTWWWSKHSETSRRLV